MTLFTSKNLGSETPRSRFHLLLFTAHNASLRGRNQNQPFQLSHILLFKKGLCHSVPDVKDVTLEWHGKLKRMVNYADKCLKLGYDLTLHVTQELIHF